MVIDFIDPHLSLPTYHLLPVRLCLCAANQDTAPIYVLAMTDLAGEARKASAIASRLGALGAMVSVVLLLFYC